MEQEANIRRGEEALRILTNPLFQESFEAVRTAYLKQWEAMPTADTVSAVDIHRRLKALEDVRTALEAHVNGGRIAEKAQSMRDKVTVSARRSLDAIRNLNRSR